MERPKPERALRRCGRTLSLVVFGWPQLLVAVPLSVGLLVHLIVGWARGDPWNGWSPAQLVRGAGFVAALAAFALLALLNLAGVIRSGWRGNGGDGRVP